jgi:hypothetical protein
MSSSAPGWSFGRVFGRHGKGLEGSNDDEVEEEAMAAEKGGELELELEFELELVLEVELELEGQGSSQQAGGAEQCFGTTSAGFEGQLAQSAKSSAASTDLLSRSLRCSEGSVRRQTTPLCPVCSENSELSLVVEESVDSASKISER